MFRKMAAFLVAMLLASASFAGGPQESNADELEAYIQKNGINKFASLMAHLLAKQAPRQIDKYTILDSAYAFKQTIFVFYSVNADLDKLIQEASGLSGEQMAKLKAHPNYKKYVQTAFWAVNAKNSCASKELGTALKYGVKISHEYKNQDGQTVVSHIVDYSDCQKELSIEKIAAGLLK